MDIQRVKFCLGRTVYFEGIPYTFTGCIMRQGNKSGFAFQAKLKDQTSAASGGKDLSGRRACFERSLV